MTQQQGASKGMSEHIPLKDRWNIGVAIAGVVVAIAGFVVVYFTLKSNDNTASINTYLQTYGWATNIDKQLFEHPEMDTYLKDTTYLKEAPAISVKTKQFAEYMLDNYDAVLNNQTYFEIDTATGRAWMRTVVKEFRDYPVLQKVYKQDSSLFGHELKTAYDSSLTSKK